MAKNGQQKPKRTGVTLAVICFRCLASVLAVVVHSAAGADYGPEEEDAEAFYSVSVYDKKRDPFADLEATVARAAREDKRILLFVGGDWCIWCKVFERTVRANAPVLAAMSDRFVAMKVDYSRWGRRGRFLRQYPKARGYPHFYVLEKDGSLLHSQSRGEFEAPDGSTAYDAGAVLAFLERWGRSPTTRSAPRRSRAARGSPSRSTRRRSTRSRTTRSTRTW